MRNGIVGGREVKLSRPDAARTSVSTSHATVAIDAMAVSRKRCARSAELERRTAATNALATTSASATNDQRSRGDALTMGVVAVRFRELLESKVTALKSNSK